MIRLAISGTGAITERRHIPAFAGVPQILIVTLQSRTLDKAARVASAMKSGEKPRAAASRDLAQTFVAAIGGEASASPSGEDGMGAVEVIEVCYRSSRSGSTIKLPLE